MEPVVILLLVLAASGESAATSKAMEAYLKQSRIDEQLDAYQRKLLSPEQRVYAGNAVFLTKMIVERRVTLKWSFP